MFHEDGGEMNIRQTGKTIRIHEFEGVYYINMKVDCVPHEQPTPCENQMCAMEKPEECSRRGR